MAIILNSPVQGKNDVPSVAGSPVAVKGYTTVQVNALTGQDPGTIVWDTDVLGHKVFNGTSWVQVSSATKWKDPVRTAVTVNNGSPPQNGGTFGGVVVANGDRVLFLANGARPQDAGIWIVNTAGLWTRPADFAVGSSATATVVFVQEGSGPGSHQGVTYVCTTPPPSDIVDTSTTTWAPIVIGGREISPGTVVYDDNSAGGGISTTNVGVQILSYGTPVIGLGANLGGYPYIAPNLDYSRLGLNPNVGPYWGAWGESSVRQSGSLQYAYPAALAVPAITDVVPTGANNGVTRGYKIVARDTTPPGGSQFGGTTAASAQYNNAAGATVQDGSNYETVTWADVSGAASYDVYLVFSSIAETLGKVGTVAQGIGLFNHQGQVGDTTSPPTIHTPRIDTYNGDFQVIPLTENVALAVTAGGGGFPTTGGGGLQAQTLRIGFRQGAGGPWQVTWPANVVLSTPVELRADLGEIEAFIFVWDKTLLVWLEIARSQLPTKFTKDPVRLCGGFNSVSPFSGAQTIDGVLTTAGDRVLITSNVFTPAQVGIYIVRAGLWDRPYDYQDGDHAEGSVVSVLAGLSRAGQTWRASSIRPNDVINTDVVAFAVAVVGGVSPSPQVGGTGYYDAATNTGIEFNYIFANIYHSGASTFTMRGEPGSGTALFSPAAREYAYLGIAGPTNFWYSAWRRIASRQYETIHVSIPFSATPTFTINQIYDSGAVFTLTLNGNVTGWTLPTPADTDYGSPPHSIECVIYWQQDGVGGWTMSGVPANVKLSGGSFVLSGAPNARDSLTLKWNRFTLTWDESSRAMNLS